MQIAPNVTSVEPPAAKARRLTDPAQTAAFIATLAAVLAERAQPGAGDTELAESGTSAQSLQTQPTGVESGKVPAAPLEPEASAVLAATGIPHPPRAYVDEETPLDDFTVSVPELPERAPNFEIPASGMAVSAELEIRSQDFLSVAGRISEGTGRPQAGEGEMPAKGEAMQPGLKVLGDALVHRSWQDRSAVKDANFTQLSTPAADTVGAEPTLVTTSTSIKVSPLSKPSASAAALDARSVPPPGPAEAAMSRAIGMSVIGETISSGPGISRSSMAGPAAIAPIAGPMNSVPASQSTGSGNSPPPSGSGNPVPSSGAEPVPPQISPASASARPLADSGDWRPVWPRQAKGNLFGTAPAAGHAIAATMSKTAQSDATQTAFVRDVQTRLNPSVTTAMNVDGISAAPVADAPATFQSNAVMPSRADAAVAIQLPPPSFIQAAADMVRDLAAKLGHSAPSEAGRGIRTELELMPEELGRLKIVLQATERGLHLQIIADRPETLDLMRRHVDVLHRTMASDGVSLAGLDLGEGGQPAPDRQWLQREITGSKAEAEAPETTLGEHRGTAGVVSSTPAPLDLRL